MLKSPFKCKFASLVFLALFLLVVSVVEPFVLPRLIMAQEDCGTLEECQKILEEYEKEISQYENSISKNLTEQKTLNNKISLLKNKIGKLELEIKQSGIMIKDLEGQIKDTWNSIEKTTDEIESSRTKLADVLRSIYEEDQKTPLEIVLANEEISDFFENLIALNSLSERNREILKDITELKGQLEEQQENLSTEKDDWGRMMKIQILQKQENQSVKSEQEEVLSETKGEEAEYQKLLAESKERAKEIRSRIFELIGVPDAPTFGEAVEIAKYVETATGVRTAFLLAVLTQESNIGKNVGQCMLKNSQTGAGIRISTGKITANVMKPSRDVAPFLSICNDLGRDPFNTPVSCPMSFGYGGAMGPAQFIPSTWNLYKDKIKAAAGHTPDPWDIKDAFMAAGVLLKDSGAAKQTYNAEWRAAMIYFSGSTKSKYSFYGNSVMSLAKGYEDDIKDLESLALK